VPEFPKNGKLQRKEHVENLLENETKKSEPQKAYKDLGVKENHNICHKCGKERLKKEYVKRFILLFKS
jgi:hypothetical protein